MYTEFRETVSHQNNKDLSSIENPHLAIIHLLKAKGCCQSSTPQPPPANQNTDLLIRKSEFQSQLNQLNGRMKNIPCSIRLEAEIYQLESVVHGLRHQNQMRKQEAAMYSDKASRTFYNTKNTSSVRSERITGLVEQELAEHRRLEQEYHQLLAQIRKIHQQNEGIVNGYDQVVVSTSFSSY